jgi:CDP-6-deoxy-D-xylo-4-hexulose-3-dehydrase
VKVLVIGASGLVGRALLRALERGGFEVLGSDFRPATGNVRLDVTDREVTRRCLSDFRPAVVFLAVNTPGGVDACEANPAQAKGLNVAGTRNVAEALAGGCRLIYYSSDYVFDGHAGPYSEADQPNPINVYGRTKWAAEQIIRSLVPDHLILRTTAVFGWEKTSPNFAMQVWERLRAGKSMCVPNDQLCNPTLADYLAEASVQLVNMGVIGTLNAVGKDRMPRSELGKHLARAMCLNPDLIKPAPTSELGQKARRPLQGGLTTGELQRILRSQPPDLAESLKRFRRQWRAETHVTPPVAAASTEAEGLKREILTKVRAYHRVAHSPRPFVPFQSRVNYAGRVFGEEEMVNLVDAALDFWLTLGPYGETFEQKMKQMLGARDFVLVNSGSSANLCAVASLMSEQLERPLRAGDEVITPAVTFPTTVAPLVQAGLVPVFMDCEIGTYNINPTLLEGAVSEKTRAIFVPHTLGNPCDMDVICELARRHSLYLVEDACDALGSRFRNRLVGTFGDMSTFSFYPAHHITMGEGGAVAVNNARLLRVVRSVRDWGRDCWCAPGESNTCGRRFGWQVGDLPCGYDHKYIYSNLGYNLKPTDMQAAIGVAQADRLSAFVEQRRKNFQRFYRGLESYQDHLVLPTLDPRSVPSWFGFPITVKNGVFRRDLVSWLENAGIETREIFGGNILKQPGYRNIHRRVYGNLEQTDRIMRDTFFIGVYPGLTEAMIDFVIGRFEDFFKKNC